MPTKTKFFVAGKQQQTPTSPANVRMYAIHRKGDEESFWTATPSGTIDMYITNLEAAKMFELNQEYIITFEKAE